MRSERPEQDRQSKDEIIERRSGVRCCSLREVFEIVMTHDQSRTLRAHPDARHPRVTIRVCEINIPRDKNVRVIGAPRRENQRAQDRNFNCDEDETPKGLHKIDNRKSEIKNRKLNGGLPVVARCGRVKSWTVRLRIKLRRDSLRSPLRCERRLRPPGFEPGTKGL